VLQTPSGDPLARVITTAQARRLGYTPGKLRTELRLGRWDELVRGVYLTRGDLPTRSDWIRAGLAIAGRGAVLSGWDALRARGIGSEQPASDEVLVLASGGAHRVNGRVRIRPSRREVWPARLAIPGAGSVLVAGTARAVADTSLVHRSLAPVRALVTTAVQEGLCTPDELWEELLSGPRNGSAHLRHALEDVFGVPRRSRRPSWPMRCERRGCRRSSSMCRSSTRPDGISRRPTYCGARCVRC
jgi:hypothetical protein